MSAPAGSAPSATECALEIVEAFARYNAEFRAITRRAPGRFDNRDARGSQLDAVERIELYDRFVNQTIAELRRAAGRGGRRPRPVAADPPRVRRAHHRAGGPGVHQDLLQLDQPQAVRHRRGRPGPGVRGDRPGSAGEHPLRARHAQLRQPRLTVAVVRGPAGRRALPLAVARPRQEHRAHRRRGARSARRAHRAARGRAHRGAVPGVLPDLARLHRRAPHRPQLRHAAGDRAEEHRWRRAGRCGDPRRGGRQHRLQLHALLLPRRPRARRRGGRVPEVDHAAQAGERAVHRARPRQAGQDRTLPRADAPPGPCRRPVRARRGRARPGDGVLHAALLRRRLQGDPRPLRLPQDRAARRGAGQVPAWCSSTIAPGAWWTPRSSAACASRGRASRRSCSRSCGARPAAPCTRTARTWCSITCTSSAA